MKEYYLDILRQAAAKAKEALLACRPTPVAFQEADLDNKPLGPAYVDDDGICGGAYIEGIHGKDALVNFFKKYGKGQYGQSYELEGFCLRRGAYKGYILSWSKDYYRGQSYEKYKAGAEAFAQVLNENGISCRAKAYID